MHLRNLKEVELLNKNNNKQGEFCSLILIPICVFSGILLIASDFSGSRVIGSIILVGGFISIGLIYLISTKVTKKTRKRRINNRDTPQMPFNLLYRTRQVNTSSSVLEEKSELEEKPIKKILIESFYLKINLLIRKSISNCMICKLQLRNEQLAYQCPQSKSYFHEEHLNEWLNDKDECPVCNFILKSL